MRQLAVAAVLPLVLLAVALTGVGRGDHQGAAALIESLRDEDPNVRMSAAYGLGQIGPAAKGAVPALVKLLQDEDPNVRMSAAIALSKIGPAGEEQSRRP